MRVGERRENSVQLVSRPFQFRENGILYPVDWWGVKYLYEELETGDSTDFYLGPNDITYPEFDEWLREKDVRVAASCLPCINRVPGASQAGALAFGKPSHKPEPVLCYNKEMGVGFCIM